MPGAHLLDIVDGTLVGDVDLSLGPFGTRLTGEAGFREVNDADHCVLMSATARESTGDGEAALRMRSRLTNGEDAGTRVEVDLQVRLAGRLDGPIVRRLMVAAAEILLRRFIACVRARLEDSARGCA